MKLFYAFATRSRPDKMFAALDNITSLARHDDYSIGIVADNDDPTMNNGHVWNRLFNYNNVFIDMGNSKTKVQAINRGGELFKEVEADVLIVMSDDMVFTKEGFDLDIIEGFIADDDTFDLFLAPHFPDGYTADKLITMSIMGKDLYNRLGYVYYPEYKSLWCDNDFLETVKRLGVYKYINKNIFRHEHPANNSSIPVDAQYKHTESFHNEDFITYKRRMVLNFGL